MHLGRVAVKGATQTARGPRLASPSEAMHCVRWNPNPGLSGWIACANHAGLIVLLEASSELLEELPEPASKKPTGRPRKAQKQEAVPTKSQARRVGAAASEPSDDVPFDGSCQSDPAHEVDSQDVPELSATL